MAEFGARHKQSKTREAWEQLYRRGRVRRYIQQMIFKVQKSSIRKGSEKRGGGGGEGLSLSTITI